MNAYRKIQTSEYTIEAWAGGPCLLTGQFCPVWKVTRPDGNSVQSRGDSRHKTMEAAAQDAARISLMLRSPNPPVPPTEHIPS